LVLGNFMEDSLDYLLDFQFFIAQRQDLSIAFVEPRSKQALYEVEHLPGVLSVQPFRSIAVRIRHGHRSRRVAIMGIERGTLMRLIDTKEQVNVPPPDGVVLSSQLAGLIGVQEGEFVRIEVQEGDRPVRELLVVDLIDDYSGTNAYMDAEAIHQLMKEGDTLSGCFVMVDPRKRDVIYRQLKLTPRVA